MRPAKGKDATFHLFSQICAVVWPEMTHEKAQFVDIFLKQKQWMSKYAISYER